MRKILMAFMLVLAMSLPAAAYPLSLNEIAQATCRVGVSGASGSGTAIHEDKDYVYILTNAHVVGNSRSGLVEFFPGGRKTAKIPASVIWREHQANTDVDFAIMKVAKNTLYGYKPRIIPLAPSSYQIKAGQYIASVGHPAARWAQAWEGYALRDGSSRVLFTPPPLGGQSGSGIFVNIDGYTYLGAVLTWRIGRDGRDSKGYDLAQGGAIPSSTFDKVFGGKVSYTPERTPYNYREVKTVITKIGYAKDSNGKCWPITYYDDGSYEAKVPPGTQIVQWNLSQSQCNPFGSRPGPGFLDGINPFTPPRRNPPSPKPEAPAPPYIDPGKPDVVPPPSIGGFGHGTPGNGIYGSLEELKKKNEELLNQNKGLSNQLTDAQKALDIERTHLSALKDSLDAAQADLTIKDGQIKRLEGSVKDLSSKVEGLISQIGLKTAIINDNAGKITELKDKAKADATALATAKGNTDVVIKNNVSLQTQKDRLKNGLWGVSGLSGVLLLVGGWFYRKKLRPKLDGAAENIIDKVEDKVEDKIGGYLPDVIKDFGDAKLHNLKDKLFSKVDEKLNAEKEELGKIGDVLGKISTLLEKTDERMTTMETKVSLVSAPVVNAPTQVSIEIENPVIPPADPVPAEGLRQFAELWKAEGQDPKKLALYGILYHEAVNLLRKGQLYVKGNDRTQGQEATANKLDEWVENQILTRPADVLLQGNEVIHQVMVGHLYREAVEKLRNGEFPVLGAKETANIIDRWVQQEMLRRMNKSVR